MPLTRSALDELLDTLRERLAQRLACHCGDQTDLGPWLDRCAEVIRGFASAGDRDYVEARLRACLSEMRKDERADEPMRDPEPCV
jgi:hypothetical protein